MPVLGGFDQRNYRTERLWATAKDGIRVPVSLVYRKDRLKRDGSNPLLLDGCVQRACGGVQLGHSGLNLCSSSHVWWRACREFVARTAGSAMPPVPCC